MTTTSGPVLYSSKIIKAGALLPDTKLLLAHWDRDLDVPANLARMRQENLFGKASRSRIEDILVIFRQRYLTDQSVLDALLTFMDAHIPSEALDAILYYLSARSDSLLHDAVTLVAVPKLAGGQQHLSVFEMENWIEAQVKAGKTERPWGDETIERTAQGIMSTLRDFGILRGKVNKEIVPLYLPTISFAFIAFLLSGQEKSGEKLLSHPDWQLFFLPREVVENFLLEAHQERLLDYRAAGQVIRIDFPANSIEEYARVIAQRAY